MNINAADTTMIANATVRRRSYQHRLAALFLAMLGLTLLAARPARAATNAYMNIMNSQTGNIQNSIEVSVGWGSSNPAMGPTNTVRLFHTITNGVYPLGALARQKYLASTTIMSYNPATGYTTTCYLTGLVVDSYYITYTYGQPVEVLTHIYQKCSLTYSK